MLDKSTLSDSLPSDQTLREDEISKFDKLAREWWDPNGKMAAALNFNRARLNHIERQIQSHFSGAEAAPLSVLDIGCGGGLVSEPLAKKGFVVTGIDASAVSIEVAKHHARQYGVEVDYQHRLASDVLEQGEQFDIVINAEVVEHVKDQALLIEQCCRLVKPGGMLVLATLNKTIKSFVIAIVGAEYIMRYLPVGTHDWRYFVKPETLQSWVSKQGLSMFNQTGMRLNPLTGNWEYTQSTPVNYCQCYAKPKAGAET